jgi:ATP-dependent RNA helicase DeaD
VETILAEAPTTTQIALFSATMPAQIRRLSAKYLTNAAEITVAAKTMTAAKTRQRHVQLANNQKIDALTRLLEVEPFEAMIVFVRTKKATEELAERLRARGFSAAAINGDLVQAQRERTIGQLKSGALDILVATDVAARGLDVERISHVVNYDIPLDSESYVHRIGRTGRAGRSGEAVTFVTPRERNLLASIEKATRQKMTPMPLPSVEDVNTSRIAKFNEAITMSLDSKELPLFRDLLEKYQHENNVSILDVAAAVALMSQDDNSFFLEPDPAPRPVRERSEDYADRGASRGRNASGRDRASGDRGDRFSGERSSGPRERRSNNELATYRISVGHRQKVMPGAIVGAIANEGGLGRADFGKIDINSDHTLVELPAELSPKTLKALKETRISGVLIELERVAGGDSGARGGYTDDRPSRGDAPRSGAPRRSGGGPRTGAPSRTGGAPARGAGAPRKEWSKPISDDEPSGAERPAKRNAAPSKGAPFKGGAKGTAGKSPGGKTFGAKAGGTGKRAAAPNKDKGKPKRARGVS